MSTLFISDLHLAPGRPCMTRLFMDLLSGEARHADGLYILGDLFEYWIGDDAANRLGYAPIVRALRALADTGVPVYFMRGNRDFLVGERFARETGCRILADPAVVDLYGEPALLMHGDFLCSDDIEHQKFRAMVDEPAWQRDFLAQPVETRLEMAKRARAQSREHKDSVAMDIMDVNEQAVRRAFEAHHTRLMIHGHTHRPAIHDHAPPAGTRRIVLGDWYQQSSILRCTPGAQELEPGPDDATNRRAANRR